jgi:CheY-like chemotaxis protein/Flp pilus assembly protein TadD
MSDTPNQFNDATALVIDGNTKSRSILASQLRDLGVGSIAQCNKLADARVKLEAGNFDIVLCEQYFEHEETTGQDLLDELRRNQLLPFYTVFVIITAEATYTNVAEAAESALDAYLLKPHTANNLSKRLSQARERKLSLKTIFAAIDQQRFKEAGALCAKRFSERGPYWLYAARIGAELMLRTGQISEAQRLYEAVVAANTLPWAKLGVACAQLESGEAATAATTLEGLIESDPSYTDAYDMMSRAQFELGNFQNALNTFRRASKVSPGSVTRLLKHGMLAYYAGDREQGVGLLDRATRIGLESKLYDPQALVLLAFAKLDSNDQRGLQRCVDQMQQLCARQPSSQRMQRLLGMVQCLLALQDQQTALALDEARSQAKLVHEPSFDCESAGNLLALMTRLTLRSVQLYELDAVVDTIGLRYCTSRSPTELLACMTAERIDFTKRIRAAHTDIVKLSEHGMALSLSGEPKCAVEYLLEHGERTLNAKLIESAFVLLDRHMGSIPDEAALTTRAQHLREGYQATEIQAGLDDQP